MSAAQRTRRRHVTGPDAPEHRRESLGYLQPCGTANRTHFTRRDA